MPCARVRVATAHVATKESGASCTPGASESADARREANGHRSKWASTGFVGDARPGSLTRTVGLSWRSGAGTDLRNITLSDEVCLWFRNSVYCAGSLWSGLQEDTYLVPVAGGTVFLFRHGSFNSNVSRVGYTYRSHPGN